jgi:hypothetical protein
MRTAGKRVPSKKINKFLIEHPAASWVIWVLAILLQAPVVTRTAVLTKPPHFGWIAWVIAAYLLFTPFLVAIQIRGGQQSASDVLFIRWALAQGPILMSLVGVFLRAPQWLGSIALGEAIILMVFAQRKANRSDQIGLSENVQ